MYFNFESKKYEIEISHKGLSKYRIIKDKNKEVAQKKAESQLAEWENAWSKKTEKIKRDNYVNQQYEKAKQLTCNALVLLNEIENILADSLKIDANFSWTIKKEKRTFKTKPPTEPKLLNIKLISKDISKFYKGKPNMPQTIDSEILEKDNKLPEKPHYPKLKLIDRIIFFSKQKIITEYEEKLKKWESDKK